VEASDRGLTAPRVDGWSRRLGTVRPTDHPRRGRGEALCNRATRVIRIPRNPAPHHASGRHQRGSPPTCWLESLCHQCGAPAAVLAGCGGVPPPCIRVERLFNRLKSGSISHRWCVKLHEPIEGLTYLLTLGSGCERSRSCPATVSGDSAGLTPRFASRRRATDDRHTPTAERILTRCRTSR